MNRKIAFKDRINTRILTTLLIIIAVTAVIVSTVNQNNIRHLYEQVYTERVLLTNALMATVIQSDDVKYFVDLMQNKDDAFKQRQVQFYYDRIELWELQDQGAGEEEQQVLLDRLSEFQLEMSAFKTDEYWAIIDQLRELKDVSNSTYLYVMAKTGLSTSDGEMLFTFIFDADDEGIHGSPDVDGLGTSDVSQESIQIVYDTGEQMDWVYYYNDVYGELYYAYAPIIYDGAVIAVFGTDLELESMNAAINASALLFNMIFLLFSAAIILCTFIFLRRSITKPLSRLTDTADELARGNVYAPTPQSALKQPGEIGMLAGAINDMSGVYQDMIKSSESLFAAANIGKLDIRNDETKFKGDVQKVVRQINDTLDVTTQYLNGLPESIFIMSKDFETYFRNEQYVKCFGTMSAKEFIAQIIRKENTEDLQTSLADILSRHDFALTAWIEDKCFSVLLKEIEIKENNENSVLVIAIDITDLMEEKENAQAAAQAKSDFLSNMSHEMRTPMNAIIGMSKIAENSDDASRIKYCLDTIRTSSEHLLGIINDILDMSKIEAGKFELDIVHLNIEKMLMKVCNIVIDNMEKKQQKFNIVLSKDLDLNYMADDQRLSQVLTNLLSNAIKFTPEKGKITLSVERVAHEGDINTLRFTITDNGIGMSEDQVARLFNAFEQADGSISRKYGGTGLGLAISKNIVEKMGGAIWVESNPGEGSKFIFDVKLEHVPHHDAVIFDGISPEDLKILFIENDEELQRRFVSITENFGIHCIPEADPEEAFAMIQEAHGQMRDYDIIFLDYDMLGVNGLELVQKISETIGKNSVIIVTTFLEWHQIEDDAKQHNVTRFITKPLFPSSILDAINDVVGSTLKSYDIKTEKTNEAEDLSSVSVLLAEDMDINQEIFIALLEATNISIDIAGNGKEAVEMFKKDPDKYDLILMDIQMPEMDGYQATNIIRGMDLQKAKDIPIIAMTANAFKEDVDRCLASGMNDHIAKPIDEKTVIGKIIQYTQ